MPKRKEVLRMKDCRSLDGYREFYREFFDLTGVTVEYAKANGTERPSEEQIGWVYKDFNFGLTCYDSRYLVYGIPKDIKQLKLDLDVEVKPIVSYKELVEFTYEKFRDFYKKSKGCKRNYCLSSYSDKNIRSQFELISLDAEILIELVKNDPISYRKVSYILNFVKNDLITNHIKQ